MKARGAAVQAGLAAAALVLAAAVWLRPVERSVGEVTVLDLPRGSVERVHYDDGSRMVEVRRVRREAPEALLVLARSPSLRPPPDAGVPGRLPADGGVPSRASAVAPEAPDRELRGNALAEGSLERFSPLTAARSLGVLVPSALRDLSLETDARRLEVTAAAQKVGFRVGLPSGTGSAYLRADADGRVYVLAGTLISDLTSAASRLVDRRLHAFKEEEADHLGVQADGRARSFVQRRVAGAIRIAPASSPEVPDLGAHAFFDRVWKLAAADVLGRGEEPSAGPPHLEVRADYAQGGRPLGFVEIARAGSDLYARSELTVSWVRLPLHSEAIVDDASRVVGADVTP